MLENNNLADQISAEVKEICFRSVSTTEPLIASGLIDSIGMVDLAIALENKFNIVIPFQDMNESLFYNVQSITEYILKKQDTNVF